MQKFHPPLFGVRARSGGISNFRRFCKKLNSLELLNSIFENSSPKGSFGRNKRKFEFSVLSRDSRKIQSDALKSFKIFSSPYLFFAAKATQAKGSTKSYEDENEKVASGSVSILTHMKLCTQSYNSWDTCFSFTLETEKHLAVTVVAGFCLFTYNLFIYLFIHLFL